MALSMEMTTTATAWWDARFHAFGERIPFKSIFFPLLLQTCDAHESQQQQQQQHALSQDELAAIVKHCVAENAWMHGFVTQRDVRLRALSAPYHTLHTSTRLTANTLSVYRW